MIDSTILAGLLGVGGSVAGTILGYKLNNTKADINVYIDNRIVLFYMENNFAMYVPITITNEGSKSATISDFKIKLWCFDTQVYNYAEFDNNNLDDILDYEPMGGGGTMFECNWQFMRDNEIEPNRFVMFTDGYPCGSWGDEHYCDTVFIIHGPDTIKPPFGNYAYYDHKQAA